MGYKCDTKVIVVSTWKSTLRGDYVDGLREQPAV